MFVRDVYKFHIEERGIMAKGDLMLTESRYNSILKWMPRTEEQRQEEEILKYLKEASEAMKAKWPENDKKKLERKKENRKLSDEEQRYEAIKNATPEERRAMIEEAEKFVSTRKIKECPIELRSAAILCENLYGRDVQLKVQAQQKTEEKAKTEIRNKLDMAQSVAWLSDGWQHRTNAHSIAKQHKQELLDMVNEKKARRDAEKAERIKLEKEIIEQHFQKAAEEKLLAKKKREEMQENMRQHEVQTNLMAQQKRDRVKRENEVIDVLVKVHNEGKSAIKEMIKVKEREAKINHIKLGAKLQKMGLERHFDEAKKLENEQKLIAKAQHEKEKFWDQRDLKALERKEKLKNDRLEDYNQSLRNAVTRQTVKKEEDKEYFKSRVMNDKISQEYIRMKKETRDKKTRETLRGFKEAATETRHQHRAEREAEKKKFNEDYERDTTDKKFYDYAKDLIDDAEKKNRPTKPIMQAIKAFKNSRCIDIVKRTRPHEISNVPIEEEIQKFESDWGKSKRQLKYERDEKKMVNVYRSTKFLNV